MKHFIVLTLSFILASGICSAQEHTYALQPQTAATTDTTFVLCIGNSFTYYYDSYNMLSEIAWSQGHFLQMKSSCIGGYTFGCHLAEPKTLKSIVARENENATVFLQNQSQLNARIGCDPKRFAPEVKDAEKLVERIREYYPDGRCIFESTWSYPRYNCGSFGTLEAFDAAMLKGTKLIAKKCKAEVSPIGNAFTLCRERHPEIPLLYTDNHHQSKEGSYLKSCVNYLMLFGGTFAPETSCCGLDRDVAAKLQKVAFDAFAAFK